METAFPFSVTSRAGTSRKPASSVTGGGSGDRSGDGAGADPHPSAVSPIRARAQWLRWADVLLRAVWAIHLPWEHLATIVRKSSPASSPRGAVLAPRESRVAPRAIVTRGRRVIRGAGRDGQGRATEVYHVSSRYHHR